MEMKDKLGTTDIDSKMQKKKGGKPDFEKEKQILKRELKLLGLRK